MCADCRTRICADHCVRGAQLARAGGGHWGTAPPRTSVRVANLSCVINLLDANTFPRCKNFAGSRLVGCKQVSRFLTKISGVWVTDFRFPWGPPLGRQTPTRRGRRRCCGRRSRRWWTTASVTPAWTARRISGPPARRRRRRRRRPCCRRAAGGHLCLPPSRPALCAPLLLLFSTAKERNRPTNIHITPLHLPSHVAPLHLLHSFTALQYNLALLHKGGNLHARMRHAHAHTTHKHK